MPSMTDTPTPPSQFLAHLFRNPREPTRELVKPYVSYETGLRKAFARGDAGIDGLAGLVPVYNGAEKSFRIRTVDRQPATLSKYIMPLPDDKREANDVPAIAASRDEFMKNFDAFTHSMLKGIDIKIENDPTVENPHETYYQTTAPASDIDVFFYGLGDDNSAIARIVQLEAELRVNQRIAPGSGLTLRSENAVTFISPRWPYRHVQVILRLYRSVSEILTGFDVDCACVAFDGTNVYSNPRGVTAIATRTNTIDLTRRSPSYENRLYKYRNHNFDVFWDGLERERIDEQFFRDFAADYRKLSRLTGLARLIFSEAVLGRGAQEWYRWRRLMRRLDSGGEPALAAPSGYATLDIPYGRLFTAKSVCKYVSKRAKEPYLFGSIEKVTSWGAKPSKKMKGKLAGKVTFIRDNPGRQMIGSFYPLTDDDWTNMAYEPPSDVSENEDE
ncbi:ankyrin repeat protein [Hirsutella rhossiliensis]|uniref:Ankyrin repeat protein n=1 Tax=Hirsutella rhossiliensis TaxID=111463 RepID=A0A9P8N2L8_9HYPO|nr:ankyrin repeat protein [Hirsutella rhossiliensis]KAH0966523.1 ankyrin repeat protein [Hirsutella rhossiliensis]